MEKAENWELLNPGQYLDDVSKRYHANVIFSANEIACHWAEKLHHELEVFKLLDHLKNLDSLQNELWEFGSEMPLSLLKYGFSGDRESILRAIIKEVFNTCYKLIQLVERARDMIPPEFYVDVQALRFKHDNVKKWNGFNAN